MDKILPYLKTILRGIKGIIPNDIYIDQDQIIIYITPGANVTTLKEEIFKRIKPTWLANYLNRLELKQGYFSISFKDDADKLNEIVNEALELNVSKDKELKLPVDEIIIRNYDETVGYAGRSRKPMVDWITEYNYLSEKELTEDEFQNLLKEKGYNPTGMISFSKRRLRYGNGKIYYRHICKSVMFD